MTEKEIEESHSVHCGLNATPLDGWTGPCDCIVKELRDAQARIEELERNLNISRSTVAGVMQRLSNAQMRIEELETGIKSHLCGISMGCYCTSANHSAEHDPECKGMQPFQAERNLKALLEK